MRVELDTDERLRSFLEGGESLAKAVFHGLDLRPVEGALAERGLKGALFAGCHLSPPFVARAIEAGALVFPRVDGRDFDPWRPHLYSPEELYAGFDPARPDSYRDTPDYRIYSSFVDPGTHRPRAAGLDDVLVRRLHDFAIADALAEFLEATPSRGVVAIMGGHDQPRGEGLYLDVARLSRELTREGFLLVSGGGPGLMEATNLGAYLAPHADGALESALGRLAEAPVFDHPQWLAAAFRVREAFPPGDMSLRRSVGIPTWFYGHEPPNPFTTHVAKYFENSVREEGLLAMATHGVVFAPGNAGTVQEIFQDACQNYYRTYTHFASPMVLLGTEYWDPRGAATESDRRKPVLPLLRQLGREKGFERMILCTDSTAEVAEFVRTFRP